MKLLHLLNGLDFDVIQGNSSVNIARVQYDSRKVGQGDVFVCIEGFQTDGHQYAAQAAKQGANVLITQKELSGIPENLTVIRVENTRHALAVASANFFDNPTKMLNMIGVTGTNGKTTITYLIKSVLDSIGHKVGVVGTIENRIGDKVLHTERTTPESLELQELLCAMRKESVQDVVMEVSSHSLDLHRVDGIDYQIGIFTNLTQDHLDYHKTIENYKIAKSLLFRRSNASVINIDDVAGEFMISKASGKVITYAIDKPADLQAKDIAITADGVTFNLLYQGNLYTIYLHTPGRFSIYNALGAIGACILMDISMDIIAKGLKNIEGVSGRFQTVKSRRGFNAIVDYAHTPDGLENILNTAREFTSGSIITIFGCGGDRDRTKRPIMGEIAGKLSNYCIITSDNPRTENPEAILGDVEVGVKKTACAYKKLADRREAIRAGVKYGKPGDVLVIAGKGHENYQIFPDKTIHFDDVEEVKLAFGEDVL